MLGDDGSFDKDGLWVYRAFRYRPGQHLPERKLHFVPIPSSIPQTQWRKTALRIQHFAGTTESRRRARYDKYKEVDPNGFYQPSYENILDPPGRVRKWIDRSPSDPLLWTAEEQTR
jgi:hypothetical protein